MEDPTPPPEPPIRREAPLKPEDERLYATLIHLSGLLWLMSIPGIVGVLLVWLLKREQSAFVDEHGKEAMNFQISLLIYLAAVGLLAAVGAILSVVVVGLFLFFPALLALGGLLVFQIVVAILAAMEANKGAAYRYPLSIHFLR
ncbi:MAG: DUF4870 domain-containing protein [Verrucomicrobiales bacterium]